MKPALVVLAAGASRRLGTCKATVPIADRPAIQHLLEAASALDSQPPLVVVGAQADLIRPCLPPRVECLANPNWRAGRTGSVALAARARPDADLLIAPVSCPLVPAATFDALSRHWDEAGSPEMGWLAPSLHPPGGPIRYGHPVLLGRALARRLLAWAPETPLRELRGEAAPLLSLSVETPEILDHVIGPEDLERLRQRD